MNDLIIIVKKNKIKFDLFKIKLIKIKSINFYY